MCARMRECVCVYACASALRALQVWGRECACELVCVRVCNGAHICECGCVHTGVSECSGARVQLTYAPVCTGA